MDVGVERMTDRKKLIELLGQYARCDEFGVESCDTCSYRHEANCNVQLIADHLLANGVTFATDTNDGGKWIPTDERLPEHGDVVLCNHKQFHQVICQWDKRHNLWIDDEWEYSTDYITHWMPLPEPPKGE